MSRNATRAERACASSARPASRSRRRSYFVDYPSVNADRPILPIRMPQEPTLPPALGWPAWADRRTYAASDLDPQEWGPIADRYRFAHSFELEGGQ